jgi:hypothetical protein
VADHRKPAAGNRFKIPVPSGDFFWFENALILFVRVEVKLGKTVGTPLAA